MNILIFGPNGSGKGTQSSLIQNRFGLEHIESGEIFRSHISNKTPLGIKAQKFTDRGELVPDEITIPMVLDVLESCDNKGWLLDGFPRNLIQAQELKKSLDSRDIKIDYVIEIDLEREIAKNRIMGRRICTENSHHPNNVSIPGIEPNKGKCRVCGGVLKQRPDDRDENAINRRHDVYYNDRNGTLAACNYFKLQGDIKHVVVNGANSIKEIKQELIKSVVWA